MLREVSYHRDCLIGRWDPHEFLAYGTWKLGAGLSGLLVFSSCVLLVWGSMCLSFYRNMRLSHAGQL